MRKAWVALAALAVFALLSSCATRGSGIPPEGNKYIAANAEAYDQAAGRVRIAKSRLSGDSLVRANLNYDDAKAQFKGLSEMIEVAVRTGTPLDVAEYAKRSEQAKQAQRAFVSYVDSEVAPNAITDIATIVATAGKVADFGLDAYTKWRTLNAAERKAYADLLREKTVWATWDDVR